MNPNAALQLDERGVLCPLPVIHLAQQITSIGQGELIEVLADDPAAATDIPAWCAMKGHELVSASHKGGPPLPSWTSYLVRRLD